MPEQCRECLPASSCSLSRARWFQRIMKVRSYSRNSTIIRQGEPVRHVHVLRRGWVLITHVMPNGKGLTDLVGPGSVIGAAWALSGDVCPYTATAMEECETEQAEAEEFIRFLKTDPEVTMDLLRFVSRQMRRLMRLFYDAAAKTPSDVRLLETLREISSTCGVPVDSGLRIRLPLPVQVLADRIGCSRQWASKLLGELEARGAVQRNGSWITLTEVPDNS